VTLHHRNKNERIRCLEPLRKEEQSIKARAFWESAPRTRAKQCHLNWSKNLLNFIKKIKTVKCFLEEKKKGVCEARMVNKSLSTLLEYPSLSSMLGSFSQGGLRHQILSLFFLWWWWGTGLKFELVVYKKCIFCIFFSVLPTWQKTNLNLLCRSHLMLRQMTPLQVHRSFHYNILIFVAPF